jgi:hypothetical protein
MIKLRRIGLTAAAVAALAVGLSATPASATGTGVLPSMPACSLNDLVGRYTDGGGGLAELDLYWDAAHQTNCVEMVHLGAAYGRAATTGVAIATCETDTSGQLCTAISGKPPYYGSDYGNYAYHAGPASVTGAGHCIYAAGTLALDGTTYVIATAPNSEATHC